MNLRPPPLSVSLAGITAGALLSFGVLEALGGEWRGVAVPLHAAAEATGGVAVVVMAVFLLQRRQEEYGGKLFLLALGFLSMGLLDLFHAATVPGKGFVLLRSAASFAGGAWFALTWVPGWARDGEAVWKNRLPWLVLAAVLVFAVWTMVARETLPAMVREGEFTPAAKALNLLAGAFFAAGAARLYLDSRCFDKPEIQLFACIATLFGVANLLFPFSALWDDTWWLWHLLRLSASLLALGVLAQEYREAVAERRQVAAGLEEAERRYRILFERSPDGILLIDPGTALPLEFNDAAHRQLGYSRGEFARLRVADYEAIENPAEVEERIGRILRQGRDDFETCHRAKGGEIRDVLVTVQRIEWSGRPVFHCIFRDITARKQAERQQARLLEELQRSNAELEQFAYVASHDLQEPLRMVSSYTQLLARRYRGRLDADADEFIAYAVDGATRMQQLINDLLAFSRVSTRGNPFAPTEAEAALAQALVNLRAAVAESRAVVTHDPLPTVRADASQLVQLLQNLIGNALKFRGAAPPQIHIAAQQMKGLPAPGTKGQEGWVFSVRDNGIGIAPEYHERIFVLFQRLHNKAEYPGTGIGLAICKRIAERHGGRIWLESAPGKGSTFYFTLPAQSP